MSKVTFAKILNPFYIAEINDLVLDGEAEADWGDFQAKLKLSDSEVERLNDVNPITNLEAIAHDFMGRKIFTIASNAEITQEDGVFYVTDIFGEQHEINIQKSTNITLDDVLNNVQSYKTDYQEQEQERLVCIIPANLEYLETHDVDRYDLAQEQIDKHQRNQTLIEGVSVVSVSKLLSMFNESDPNDYFYLEHL
ncbi:hypothetical protein [Acinetobacter sp. P1(2025)]|uniref:hypothetical protein n=1 Tax=Acinetobacter sp. P1(2025) TaxID=3446120 RepID=UPI003F53133C